MRASLFASLAGAGPMKALAVIAVVSLAGAAAAAITITYSNSSTVATTATSAPVQFVAGDDSAIGRYVTAYSLSTNRTYFTATLAGIPEAQLVVGSFVKLQNVDSASHSVTLSTSNVTNSLVTAYTIQILDGSNNVQGTLDLRSASSTVSTTFTLPASTTWTAKVTLTLASGAGANNVAPSNSISLSAV